MLTGRDPVPLGGRINLKNVGSGAKNWLLPAEVKKIKHKDLNCSREELGNPDHRRMYFSTFIHTETHKHILGQGVM